jgi:hypothetical protein
MKITRDQLLGSDFKTLFTHDPATFFEGVLINILWVDEPKSVDMALVERQRHVFIKWLEYYTANLKTDYRKEVVSGMNEATRAAIKDVADMSERAGFLRGQIHALHNLPIKKNMLGKTVDLMAVADNLRQLKASEPIGVTENVEEN